MERQKYYGKRYLTRMGWSELIAFLELRFSDFSRISCETWKNNGSWSFDNFSDFMSDLSEDYSTLSVSAKSGEALYVYGKGELSYSCATTDKKRIVAFEDFFDRTVKSHTSDRTAPEHTEDVTVFIGHGRNTDWRDLKDHLADKHEIKIECYESGSRVGHTIRDILEDMLTASSLAILIHTPEDELIDGTKTSRPNVIHETGLFQGRLGFARAIMLMKDGVNELSNVYGVQQIRYSDIRQTFGDILAWIKRESETKKPL